MEYCDCSSMAVSHGVNVYGFLIVFGLVYECVQPQTPVYKENGVALTEVPQDLPRGGAKQTRGTKGAWHFILCCL